MQVVRCFAKEDIIHVLDTPDPVRDMEIIETELILSDLQSVEKRLAGGKVARTPDGAVTAKLLGAAKELLESGLPVRLMRGRVEPTELASYEKLQLITQKPVLWVCNVGDADAATGNAMTAAVTRRVSENLSTEAARLGLPEPPADVLAASVCIVCATLEQEISALEGSAGDRRALLAEYGLRQSGLERVLQQCGRLLQLRYFYTVGPMEARAWSIPNGATAAEAAGAIHTDLQKGFIKAEIIAADDLIAAGSEAAAHASSKYRTVGKDYVMADGDVALFFSRK
jgi:ribosome-binding ATPase